MLGNLSERFTGHERACGGGRGLFGCFVCANAVELAVEEAAGHVGFGNARFVRALWEETYANTAVRAAADGVTTREELQEVQSVDVPAGGGSSSGAKKKKIGF